MTHVLAIVFFAIGCHSLLSLDVAAGVLACLKCNEVQRNNNCGSVERVCKGGPWIYCYSRMLIREYGRTKVDRGCTKVCRSVKKKVRFKYEEIMKCCEKDLCNNFNFWTAEK